ncbi:hypothetical protein KKA95_02010 [Patescibacteria group bacterium]|nr:hypothetical protein [Patescibacteria group bacterium]
MSPRRTKSAGAGIVTHWDGRDFLGRLQLVKDNRSLFYALGLITKMELEKVDQMTESALEYVIDREDQPIFEGINLKEEAGSQSHNKFMTALAAVFL